MDSQDEIVRDGEFAKNFLQTETFNTIYQAYTSNAIARLLNSQPHETKLREFEYTKLQALSEFVHHLGDLAEASSLIQNPPEETRD